MRISASVATLPLLIILVGILSSTAATSAPVQDQLTEFDFLLLGLTVQPEPPTQVVPRNTATGLQIEIAFSDSTADVAGLLSLLPSGIEVVAELVGPGFDSPVELRGPPGDFLPIPPIERSGDFLVRDIRLERDGQEFLRASPDSATIEVIDRVLITQVTTRPLTLEEIRQKGILFGDDDFTGFNFTLALKLDSRPVTVDIPVVFDSNEIPVPIRPAASIDLDGTTLPLVNTNVVPVMMKPSLPPDRKAEILPLLPDINIPGLIVIPGDVGFLNQFFSALLIVSNGAPGDSGLSVSALRAGIVLPEGPNANEIPLEIAETDDPPPNLDEIPGEHALELDVLGVGPDGEPGTNDDATRFDPGQQGQAEFLLQGLKEGFHEISFDILGTLEGLPIGPVDITGVARGGVLVRNPQFNLTFSAPATVRAGELFSVFITVTNISGTPANQVTVRLDEGQLAGATAEGTPPPPIDTLLENESEVLEFQFRSGETGQVAASYLNVDGATGNLLFRLGVGERGVPLSPDTIVLPASASALPSDLVTAALRVLGSAWSVATAPSGTLPEGVERISKQVVLDRATEIAEAGLRVQLGEDVSMALSSLAFSWTSTSEAGYEQILRQTEAGASFYAAIGNHLGAPSQTTVELNEELALELGALPSHILVGVGRGTGAAPVTWDVSDAAGRSLLAETLENATVLPLASGQSTALLTRLGSSLYEWSFTSTAAGSATFDLTVTLPRADGTIGFHVFEGVAIDADDVGRLTIDLLVSNPTLVLEIDGDGDGVFESTVDETPGALPSVPSPTLLAATVIGPETLSGADPWGRVVALLFNREMRESEVLESTNFSVEENDVLTSSLQLSGRLAILFLGSPVHDFPEAIRDVTVSGLFDATGQALATATTSMGSRLLDDGAIVLGRVLNAEGTPVPDAEVLYVNTAGGSATGLAKKTVDGDGRYQFDYVRQSPNGPFFIRALDPGTGSIQELSSTVRNDGETLVVDLVLLGRGGVTGVVTDGSDPVPNAQVLVTSEVDGSSFALTETDGEGRYVATGIVVGPFSVKAVSGTSSGLSSGNLQRAGTFTTSDVVINLTLGSVSGRVLEVGQDFTNPVPNLTVFYLVPEPGTSRELVAAKTTSDAEGVYGFADVPVPIGEFRIVALDPVRSRQATTAPLVFGPGVDMLVDVDVLFQVEQFGAVEVTVYDPDGVPVGTNEAIVRVSGLQLPTDVNGKALFPELPEGAYAVSARAVSSARSVSASTNVLQTATSTVNLQLPGAGTLVVTVLDENGDLLEGQQVFRVFGGPCGGEIVSTGTASDPEPGVARFTDVPLGNVTVKAVRGSDLAVASTVVQRDGEERVLVLQFAGFGEIAGSVVDPNGDDVLGASVVLASRRIDGTLCTFITDGAAQQVRTGLDGTFRFQNVPLGVFSVSASEPTFSTPTSVSDVLRTPAESKNIVLTLESNLAGELNGIVLLPDGTTPAGHGVNVTVSGAGRPDVTVSTEPDGRYSFAAIFPKGGYTLVASDPITGRKARETIFLLEGQDAVRDLRLLGRSPVEVTVLKGDGTKASEAFVELKTTGFPFDVAAGNITPFDDGVIVFPRISEGRFTITASDREGRGGRANGTVSEDDMLTPVTLTLSVTGRVTGRFLNSSSDPIPNAEVILRQGSTGRLLGSTTTASSPDGLGEFIFDFVPAGTVLATATDPLTGRIGEASGAIEREDEVLDLVIVELGLGTVSGRVTSGGVGVEFADVELTSTTGLSSSLANLRITQTSGADGVFLFEGVPVGSFTVKATLPGASALTGSVSGNIIDDGDVVSDLEVALEPSGSILGEVQRAGGVDIVPGASLTLEPPRGTLRGQSNGSGAFRFDFVPTGDFTLTADESGGPDAGIATGTLSEGEELVVNVVFNGTGTIQGTALDSVGDPLTAGRVRLSRPTPFARDEVVNVADGSFTFLGVPVGDYNLSLTVDGSPLSGTTSGNIAADGAVSNVSVQLAPATSVVGTVLKPDGQGTDIPAANVVVTVSGAGYLLSALTDTSGAFSVPGVPEGPVTVLAQDPLTGGLQTTSDTVVIPDPGNPTPLDVGTLVLDLEPIQVASVVPASGAVAIAPDADIVITFTDPVELNGIPGRLVVSSGVANIPGSTSLSPDQLTVTFDPSLALPPNAAIDVFVSSALKDTFGRSLGEDVTSSFTTGGAVLVGSVQGAGTGVDVNLTAGGGTTQSVTDTSGAFRFENVPVGPATVVATNGSLTGSVVVDVGANDGFVDVGSILLQEVATLSGTVLEFDASVPAETLEVRVSQLGTVVGFTTTEAGGTYTLSNIPLGAFTLDVTNPTNADRGRRTGTLALGGLTGFDVTMNGVGDLLVTVEDENAARLEGVELTLSYVVFGSTTVLNATTDVNGEASFADVAFGSISLSAFDPQTSISTSTSTTIGPGVDVVLVLEPPGAIAGTVSLPGGGPAAGATVRVIRESGNVLEGEDLTTATGAYSLTDLNPSLSPYRVDVLFNGTLRARERSITAPSGGTATVDITLTGVGTVSGQVTAPSGESLSSNVLVTLTSLAPDIGGIQTTTTSLAQNGNYTFTDVPVGDVRVTARDTIQGFLGEEQDTLTADGETLTVNIELEDNAFLFSSLGEVLRDGNGALYRVAQTGAIVQAEDLLFDASEPDGLLLDVTVDGGTTRFTGEQTGTREEDGLELVTAVEAIGDLNVQRKIYAPADGYFARYVEIFENVGAVSLDVSAEVVSNIRSSQGSPEIVDSFDGDALVGPGELWLVVDDSNDADPFTSGVTSIPATAFVLADGASTTPTSVELAPVGSHGKLTVGYELSLAPGERAFLLHFVSQELSRAAASAAAERLVSLPPEALEGLEADELTGVGNFDVPANGVSAVEPLPPLDGRVSGRILASDGQTRVGSATGVGTLPVLFQSEHILYRRVRLLNVTSGSFRFAGDPSANIAIPRVGFTLDTSLDAFGETLPVNVTSDFEGATLMGDAPSVTSTATSNQSTLHRAFDGDTASFWQGTDTSPVIELVGETAFLVQEVEVVPQTSATLTDVTVELYDAADTLVAQDSATFSTGNEMVLLSFGGPELVSRVVVTFEGGTKRIAELTILGDSQTPAGEIGHALRDLVFAGTSSIDVTVTRFDGTPQRSTTDFIAASGTEQTSTDTSGRLFFAPVPASATPMTVAARAIGTNLNFLKASAVTNLVPNETAIVNVGMPQTSAVTGTVFDGDGTPISSQNVSLTGVAGAAAGEARNASTNASGVFTFADVPSGDYLLRVIRNFSTFEIPITVTAPTNVVQNFNLPVFGEVSVTVRFESAGPTNPPASGALVSLIDSLGRTHSFRSTNASGIITSNYTNVPGGVFTLSVRHPSNTASTTLDASHAITTTGELVAATVVIPAFGTVEGTVTLGSGTDVASFADVDIAGTDVTPATDVADGSGFYRLTNVRAVRPLTLTAHHPTAGREHITADANAQLSDEGQTLSVPITLPRTGTVDVTVTDESSGDGIQNVEILVQDSFSTTFRSEGVTDANGLRSVTIVPEGSFTVRAELSGQFVGEETASLATHGEVVAISIVRPSDATVEGTVFASDGVSVLADAPVELRSENGAILLDSTTADAAGAYRFVGALAPGTSALVRASFPGDVSIQQDEAVTSSQAGETLTQDVTLGVSVIKGRVLEADGTTPVANALVDLNPEGTTFLESTVTDANGDYVFLNEPDGAFELIVEDTFGLVSYALSELVAGSNLELDVLLPEHGTVQGFVTGNTTPLTGTVQLTNANVLAPRTTSVDGSGSFTFQRVAVGSFSVGYDDPTGELEFGEPIVIPGGAVGRITTGEETVNVSVAIPPTGTVQGEVQDDTGMPVLPDEGNFAILEGRNQETSDGIYSRSTEVDVDDVTYSQQGVPEGEITVVADSPDGTGLATGTVTGGSTTVVDVQVGDAALLPLLVEPGHDVSQDGTIVGETDGVTADVPVFFHIYTNQKAYPLLNAASEDVATGELTLGPVRVGGVQHTRRALIPTGAPYVRMLEVFDNTNAVSTDVSLFIEGELYLPGTLTTPSGDVFALEAEDRYLAGATADGSGIAIVWAGATATRLPDFTGADDEVYQQEWRDVTIPPGGRVILMHFAVQAVTEGDAATLAETLMNLISTSTEIADIPQADRDAIVNYELP